MNLKTTLLHSAQLKTLLGGTVVAVAIGAFVFTGVGNRAGSFSGLEPSVAARVGNQTISMRSLQSAVDNLNRQSSGNNDETRSRAHVQNALNQLIEGQVLINEAAVYGWDAADLETADWIKRQDVFQDPATKKFDKNRYQKFLKSGQMGEFELFERGKESVIQEKLLALMQLPATVPTDLAAVQRKLQATQFTIALVELKAPEKNVRSLVEASLKNYLVDANNIKILKEQYEKRKTEFVREAQVKVETILVAFQGAERAVGAGATRKETDAKILAEKLLQRWKAGEKVKVLSDELNDDPKAKAAQGDGGWLDKSNTDPETAGQLAALQASQPFSSVFRTRFGYRLLKLTERRPAKDLNFEAAQGELAKAILFPKITQDLSLQIVKDAQEILEKKPQEWEAWLSRSGLVWQQVKNPVSPTQSYLDSWGLVDPLLPYLFELKKPGDITKKPVKMGEKYVVAKLLLRSTPPEAAAGAENSLDRFVALSEQRQFMSAAQRKLLDEYARRRLIQRNKSLLLE